MYRLQVNLVFCELEIANPGVSRSTYPSFYHTLTITFRTRFVRPYALECAKSGASLYKVCTFIFFKPGYVNI